MIELLDTGTKNKPHSYEVTAVELVEDTEFRLDNRDSELTTPTRYSERGTINGVKLLKGVE